MKKTQNLNRLCTFIVLLFTSLCSFGQNITNVSPNEVITGETYNMIIEHDTPFEVNDPSWLVIRNSTVSYYIYFDSIYNINSNTIGVNFNLPYRFETGVFNIGIYNGYSDSITGIEILTILNNPNRPEIQFISGEETQVGEMAMIDIYCKNIDVYNLDPIDISLYYQGAYLIDSTNIYDTIYNSHSNFYGIDSLFVLNDSTIRLGTTITYNISPGTYNMSLYMHNYNVNIYGERALNILENPNLPTIDSISPASVNISETVEFDIYCSNIDPSQFPFHSVYAFLKKENMYARTIVLDIVSINNDNSITATTNIPNNAQLGEYEVYLFFGYTDSIANTKNVTITNDNNLARITSISQDYAYTGRTEDFLIRGENFQFTQTSSLHAEMYNDEATVNINNITILNDDELNMMVTIPSNTPIGRYSLALYDDSSRIADVDFFLFLYEGWDSTSINDSIMIFSVTPNHLMLGENYEITVDLNSTEAFINSQAYIRLTNSSFNSYNAVYIDEYSIIDSSTLQFNLDVPYDFDIGIYDMTISTSTDSTMFYNAINVTENNIMPDAYIISTAEKLQGQFAFIDIRCRNIDINSLTMDNMGLSYSIEFPTYYSFAGMDSIITLNDSTIRVLTYIPYSAPAGLYRAYFYINDLNIYLNENNILTVGDNQMLPFVDSIAPSVAYIGATTDITIYLSNVDLTTFNSLDFSSNLYHINNIFDYHSYSLNNFSTDSNTITAQVTIPFDAAIGDYSLMLAFSPYDSIVNIPVVRVDTTEGETPQEPNIPSVMSVEPWYLIPGVETVVTIYGQYTQFSTANQISLISTSDENLTVGDITVIHDSMIVANLTLSANYNNYMELALVQDSTIFDLTGRLQTTVDSIADTEIVYLPENTDIELYINNYLRSNNIPESIVIMEGDFSDSFEFSNIMDITATSGSQYNSVMYATTDEAIRRCNFEFVFYTPEIVTDVETTYEIQNDTVVVSINRDIIDISDMVGEVTYTAQLSNGQPLPYWINFDPETFTIYILDEYGTKSNTVDIVIIATDQQMNIKSAQFPVLKYITTVDESPVAVFEAFPNPCNGTFQLITANDAQYEVYSVLGNEICRGNIIANEATSISIDQNSGIYTIVLYSGQNIETKQIVIQ